MLQASVRSPRALQVFDAVFCSLSERLLDSSQYSLVDHSYRRKSLLAITLHGANGNAHTRTPNRSRPATSHPYHRPRLHPIKICLEW